jgi:hypothetical protein
MNLPTNTTLARRIRTAVAHHDTIAPSLRTRVECDCYNTIMIYGPSAGEVETAHGKQGTYYVILSTPGVGCHIERRTPGEYRETLVMQGQLDREGADDGDTVTLRALLEKCVTIDSGAKFPIGRLFDLSI